MLPLPRETVVDELAEKLGIDPIEFRRINGVQEGDRRPMARSSARLAIWKRWTPPMQHPHYNAPLPAPTLRRSQSGARCRALVSGSTGAASRRPSASVNPDGTVNYLEGSTDIGGSRASLAMQLAETLGIRATKMCKPTMVDTDTVGYNDATGGSRITYGTGWAAYELGKKHSSEMAERAAESVGVSSPKTSRSKAARLSQRTTSPSASKNWPPSWTTPAARMSVERQHGHEGRDSNALATHIVDVEVDTETGKVQILRYTAVQDVGGRFTPAMSKGRFRVAWRRVSVGR